MAVDILDVSTGMISAALYTVIDLGNGFSKYIRKEKQKQFALTWDCQNHTLTALTQDCVKSPPLCQKMVWGFFLF